MASNWQDLSRLLPHSPPSPILSRRISQMRSSLTRGAHAAGSDLTNTKQGATAAKGTTGQVKESDLLEIATATKSKKFHFSQFGSISLFFNMVAPHKHGNHDDDELMSCRAPQGMQPLRTPTGSLPRSPWGNNLLLRWGGGGWQCCWRWQWHVLFIDIHGFSSDHIFVPILNLPLLLSTAHRRNLSMYFLLLCEGFQLWNLFQQSVPRVTNPWYSIAVSTTRMLLPSYRGFFKYFHEVLALQPLNFNFLGNNFPGDTGSHLTCQVWFHLKV